MQSLARRVATFIIASVILVRAGRYARRLHSRSVRRPLRS